MFFGNDFSAFLSFFWNLNIGINNRQTKRPKPVSKVLNQSKAFKTNLKLLKRASAM